MLEFIRIVLLSLRPLSLLKWVAIVTVFCLVWLAVNFEKLRDYSIARERHAEHTQAIERLQREQAERLAERNALEANGFPLEKAARERLLMVHPDEKIIFIETPEAAERRTGELPPASSPPAASRDDEP